MSFCKNHAIICDGCGKFCNPYDEEILFGTKSYEFPEPLDPYHYCKKCYLKNKKKWIHLFRNGSRHGSWQKSKAEFDNNYPQKQVAIIKVNLWTEEKQLEYIKQRVAIHKADIKECSDTEKWAKPTTYAVKKGKNKRAVRVLDSEKEAQRYIDKIVKPEERDIHHIETRLGEHTRCKSYCPVSNFCKYNIYNEANNAN